MVLLLTQVSDIGGFIIRLRCDRQNKNMSKQKRNTHTDGAVGTCLQNITWQVFVEHDGIFQTQLEMCCSDVLGHAHPAVCKRCLCGGVMALPETAERRVKPVIHSLCYNRQTGDLALQADDADNAAISAAQKRPRRESFFSPSGRWDSTTAFRPFKHTQTGEVENTVWSWQQGATLAANGSTVQLWYLIEAIPFGHDIREACSTFGICNAKALVLRQHHLDLNSHLSHCKYSYYDIGTERG